MFNVMIQFFMVGVVAGLSIAFLVWLASYACVSLIHMFKHITQ